MSERWDTLIIGGGVVGLALAFELLSRDRSRRVVVVERAAPGGGATWAAAGMLVPVSEAETESADTVALGLDSLARYPGFAARVESVSGLPTGLDLRGTLWAALDRDDREELERLYHARVAAGFRVERLAPSAWGALEPRLAGRVVAAMRAPDEGQIDPRSLTRALVRAIERLGGLLLSGVEVVSLEARRDASLVVLTRSTQATEERHEATQVVLAAGAWSFRGIALPLADPGLRPVKGQLVRLRGRRLLSHVVRTPRAYLVPRADGELLVGATVEEAGFDGRATAGAVMDLLRSAWEIVPAIDELELAETSVGFRAALDDHRPRIGATEIDGLFLSIGHYRNGVLLAPATAAYLADALLEGGAPPALAPFAPGRAVVRG
jgi:glycine oxidase